MDPYAIILKKKNSANHGSSGILSLNYFEPFCTSSLDFNRFNIHACLFSSTRFYPLIKIWEPLHYNFEKNYIFGHHRSPTFFKAIFEHFGSSSLGYKSILSKKNCCFCQISSFFKLLDTLFGHFDHLYFM